MHIWYTCENPWGLPSGVITFTRFSERLTCDPNLEVEVTEIQLFQD